MIKYILVALALTLMLQPAAARQNNSKSFDYYVLTLSWSPTYCDSSAGRKDRTQCGKSRRFAFVVHGLWPQYNKGWPSNCRTNEKWVSKRQINQMLDIMPSKRLIIHEWKKHGTCSRLGQRRYFNLVRKLFKKILIPARYLAPSRPLLITPRTLVDDFLKTNLKMRRNNLSVQCGNRRDRARLSELRICFNKSGNFTNCGPNEARSCRAAKLVLPPLRVSR